MMNISYDQVIKDTLQMAQSMLQELEDETTNSRKHQTPTRYQQRKAKNVLEQLYQLHPPDFKVVYF